MNLDLEFLTGSAKYHVYKLVKAQDQIFADGRNARSFCILDFGLLPYYVVFRTILTVSLLPTIILPLTYFIV